MRLFRRRCFRCVAAAILGCLLAGVPAELAAEGRPDLAHLIGRARLVVRGSVAQVTPYDQGRMTVARVSVGKVLRGKSGAAEVSVVERHDLPSSPQLLQAGHHVIAFLTPARRNSALEQTLPPGRYFEVVGGRAGVLSSTNPAAIDQAAALVTRILTAHRNPEKDPVKRAAAARALAFDEIAAEHFAVVADGAASLGRVDGLASDLTDAERLRLETALRRADLPTWVRVALVNLIAERQLGALVPALRDLAPTAPELRRAKWNALVRLGASPSGDDLAPALASPDPATRVVAIQTLVETQGAAARPQLEDAALNDPSEEVRIAATEALGSTGPEALPTLERAFAKSDWAQRRAAGRAITAIGGRAAAETYARLAFEGPAEAQKYAVTLLLLTGIEHDDPLVQRIGKTHPEEGVRHIVESGLDVHEH